MNEKEEIYLFVYGTLMSSCRQNQSYLDTATFKGEAVLNGFSLYDFGYYPCIIADKEGKVKGELYSVPLNLLPSIDIYEAEGSLYRREQVTIQGVNGEVVDAYVYVFIKSIDNAKKIPFDYLPWYEGIGESIDQGEYEVDHTGRQ